MGIAEKLVAVILIFVISFAAISIVGSTPANASYMFCEIAANFGWHAWWANVACIMEIAADIIGTGGDDW